MNTIDTDAGRFLVAGVAFPDDPANARAIRMFHGRAPLVDIRFDQLKTAALVVIKEVRP